MVAGGREHADKRQGNGEWHEPTRRVRSEGPNKSHPRNQNKCPLIISIYLSFFKVMLDFAPPKVHFRTKSFKSWFFLPGCELLNILMPFVVISSTDSAVSFISSSKISYFASIPLSSISSDAISIFLFV